MKTEKLQGRVRGKKPREILVKSNFRLCIYFGADYTPRFALHTRGLLSAICFSFRHEMMHFCLRHRAICLTFDATSCCFKRNMFAWSFFPSKQTSKRRRRKQCGRKNTERTNSWAQNGKHDHARISFVHSERLSHWLFHRERASDPRASTSEKFSIVSTFFFSFLPER